MAGWLAVGAERILEVGEGRAPARGLDCCGDLLVPGLIDLHTDHLENHLQPRPKVEWPPLAAVVAYDAQIAASGITTVFDCVRVGSDVAYRSVPKALAGILNAIESARSQALLRTEHRLHVRCEICAEDVVEHTDWLLATYEAKLISLMDHTPGARQFRNLDAWRTYYGGKSGLSGSELESLILRRRAQFDANYVRHRKALVRLAKAHGIVTASHDDATPAHVEEALADGAAIAEFPTTVEAAAACHRAGVAVLMGAPNVVRGGSHSGNVAAEALARDGVLDILSSDYVPASLLWEPLSWLAASTALACRPRSARSRSIPRGPLGSTIADRSPRGCGRIWRAFMLWATFPSCARSIVAGIGASWGGDRVPLGPGRAV